MSETKLPRIIESIVSTYDAQDGINHIEGANLPSRDRVVEITTNFLSVLFPGYYEKQELSKANVTYYIWEKIAFIYHHLSREILKSMKSVCGSPGSDVCSSDLLVYVHSVYTEPAYRRQGLARRLLGAMIDYCRENGWPRISLHASEMGRGLYEDLGFTPTNEMRLVLE